MRPFARTILCHVLLVSCESGGEQSHFAATPAIVGDAPSRGAVDTPASNRASSAHLVWEYRSGLPGPDSIADIAVSDSGNLYAAGWRSAGGSWDRWIAQLSPADGTVMWSKTQDSREVDHAFDIELGGSKLFVAGSNRTSFNDYEGWAGRFDASGNVEWQITFESGFGPDYATGVSPTRDGGVIVVGVVSREDGTCATSVRAYDAAGRSTWTFEEPVHAPPRFPFGPRLAAGAEAGFLVLGHDTALEGGRHREQLRKLAVDTGQVQWGWSAPDPGGSIHGVTLGANGEIAVTGSGGPGAFMVRRFDPSGAPLWASSECMGAVGRAAAIDGQGDVFVIGELQQAELTEIVLCKFTSEGQLQWSSSVGGQAGQNSGKVVKILPNGLVLAAGDVWSGGDMWSGGSRDAWAAVYKP